MQYVQRLENRRHHERARRVARARLVADDVPRRRLPERGRQRRSRILVAGAELVLPAVAALEAERPGLLAAALSGDGETVGEPVQVDRLRGHWPGPELSVVLAEEDPVQPTGTVLGTGHHAHDRVLSRQRA